MFWYPFPAERSPETAAEPKLQGHVRGFLGPFPVKLNGEDEIGCWRLPFGGGGALNRSPNPAPSRYPNHKPDAGPCTRAGLVRVEAMLNDRLKWSWP
ncbi:hypothetical protein V6N11_010485 [Hibiscus sabdariffa]|uniref:Uncharacterized protein n=1 Tax=Hibiscus sabdariffa TaxID=183260 RepID=A0ABR2S5F2_9ROSI